MLPYSVFPILFISSGRVSSGHSLDGWPKQWVQIRVLTFGSVPCSVPTHALWHRDTITEVPINLQALPAPSPLVSDPAAVPISISDNGCFASQNILETSTREFICHKTLAAMSAADSSDFVWEERKTAIHVWLFMFEPSLGLFKLRCFEKLFDRKMSRLLLFFNKHDFMQTIEWEYTCKSISTLKPGVEKKCNFKRSELKFLLCVFFRVRTVNNSGR